MTRRDLSSVESLLFNPTSVNVNQRRRTSTNKRQSTRTNVNQRRFTEPPSRLRIELRSNFIVRPLAHPLAAYGVAPSGIFDTRRRGEILVSTIKHYRRIPGSEGGDPCRACPP